MRAVKRNGSPGLSGMRASSTTGSATGRRFCSCATCTKPSETSLPITSCSTVLPNIFSSIERGTLPRRKPRSCTPRDRSRYASSRRCLTISQGISTSSFFSTGETSSIVTCIPMLLAALLCLCGGARAEFGHFSTRLVAQADLHMARGLVLECLAHGGGSDHGHAAAAQRGGQLVGGAIRATVAQYVQQICQRN